MCNKCEAKEEIIKILKEHGLWTKPYMTMMRNKKLWECDGDDCDSDHNKESSSEEESSNDGSDESEEESSNDGSDESEEESD
jgi:hypothetical protein